MSAQIQSHRWGDKPVAVKQSLFLIVGGLLILILVVRFRAKYRAHSDVHAFTTPHGDQRDETAREMAQHGVKAASGGLFHFHPGGISAVGTRADHRTAVQERPLFDGQMATLEVSLDQSISSASGDASAAATVLLVLPQEGLSGGEMESLPGAKLNGQFQSNFDTKRMQFQFRDLTTPDGRRYAVAGIAFDEAEAAVGVPADYSSGIGMRILGATLGTAIDTAEVVATSRIIINQSGKDALAAHELNQAISQSAGQATSSISEEATRDMKNEKAVLSLPVGSHFRVKLRATPPGAGGSS